MCGIFCSTVLATSPSIVVPRVVTIAEIYRHSRKRPKPAIANNAAHYCAASPMRTLKAAKANIQESVGADVTSSLVAGTRIFPKPLTDKAPTQALLRPSGRHQQLSTQEIRSRTVGSTMCNKLHLDQILRPTFH